MRRVLSILVLILWPLTFRAMAATIRVPQDQPTIQAGIDAAKTGDTVLVAPGLYTENINFKGKAITVKSTLGPGASTIDGGHKPPVVAFVNGEGRGSVLSGFTIQHGGAPTGAADVPANWGGGIAISGAAPTIFNNLITDNDCQGIFAAGTGELIQANTIQNTNYTSYRNCASPGTGIVVVGPVDLLTSMPREFIGNTIENNTQDKENISTYAEYFGSGGGLSLFDADGTIVADNVIRNNVALGASGGIQVTETNWLLVYQNQIYGNVAQDWSGGGMNFSFRTPQFPLHPPGPFTGLLANNTFYGNSAAAPGGAASDVLLGPAEDVFLFANNVVVGTSAEPAVYCNAPQNPPTETPTVVDHNDVYMTQAGVVGIDGCVAATFNVSGDPKLYQSSQGSLLLGPGSAAIDAGNNSTLQILANILGTLGAYLTDDAAGGLRVQDGTNRGLAQIDMGAFEFTGKRDAPYSAVVLTPNAYVYPQGDTATITAQITSTNGLAQGAVTFTHVYNGAQQDTPVALNAAGAATLTASQLAPGLHAFLAAYPGEGTIPGGLSVPALVLVNPGARITLKSSPNPSILGQAVTFQCQLSGPAGSSGIPSGTISIFDLTTGAGVTGIVPNAQTGIATLTTTLLPLGSNQIEAQYNGNAEYLPVEAQVIQVVEAPPATVTVTGTPNPAVVGTTVTFTAKVSSTGPIPTGGIAWYDGSKELGSVQLIDGSASYETSSLAVGNHNITAKYGGDSVYPAEVSAVLVEVIAPAGDFSLSVNPASASVYMGERVTVQVAVDGVNGFALPVAFSCSGLPLETTCYFNPDPSKGAGGGSQLTITTTDRSLVSQNAGPNSRPGSSAGSGRQKGPGGGLPWKPGVLLLGAALLLRPLRLRRDLRRVASLAVLALAAVAWGTGCGADVEQVGGTPAGTYKIVISGTAEINGKPVTHTTTETLTVKKWF
jgi:hypothetical protein